MTASFDDYYPSEPGYDPEAAFFAPELITSRKGRFLYKFRTLGGRGPLNGQKGLLIYGQVKIEASAASAFGPQTLFLLESELPAPSVAGPSPSLSRPSPASDP